MSDPVPVEDIGRALYELHQIGGRLLDEMARMGTITILKRDRAVSLICISILGAIEGYADERETCDGE